MYASFRPLVTLGCRRAAGFAGEIHPLLSFEDIVKKQCDITIEGVPVRASVDFFCKLLDDGVVGVIFDFSAGVSENKIQLDHYAEVECEIAWQATRIVMPLVSEIW